MGPLRRRACSSHAVGPWGEESVTDAIAARITTAGPAWRTPSGSGPSGSVPLEGHVDCFARLSLPPECAASRHRSAPRDCLRRSQEHGDDARLPGQSSGCAVRAHPRERGPPSPNDGPLDCPRSRAGEHAHLASDDSGLAVIWLSIGCQTGPPTSTIVVPPSLTSTNESR